MALSSPYKSNASSPLSNQDVGIKVSQPGFNAKTASATQLIFDSSWPAIPTIFSSTGTLTSSTSYTIAHNLGFVPFTRVFILDSSKNVILNSFAFASSYSIDETNIYLTNVDNTDGYYYYINCYNIDLTVDIDYPSLPTIAVNNAYDNNFGVKITKPDKDSHSRNPRDYILHTRYRSPLIQAIKTEATMDSVNVTGTGGTIQYVNKSGTPIWSYGFVRGAANTYQYAPYYSQAYPSTTSDGITTYITYSTSAGSVGATLVILRDPLFATNISQAFY